MSKHFEHDCSQWADLTNAQALAVGKLLSGETVTAAAEASGIARQTLSKWKNEPGPVRSALEQGREQLRTALNETMLGLCAEAVATLGAILANKKLEPSIRLRAADTVLSRAAAAGVWPAGGGNEGGLIVIELPPMADEMESEDGSN